MIPRFTRGSSLPSPTPNASGKSIKEKKFFMSLEDDLSHKEVHHLVYLCKGVVLPEEVTAKIKSFTDLIDELEKNKKIGPITKEMKEWQILFDLLQLVKRKDVIKKLKEFGKKFSESEHLSMHSPVKGESLFIPLFSPSPSEEEAVIRESSLSLKQVLQKGNYSEFWKGFAKDRGDVIIEIFKASKSSDMHPSFASQGDIQSRLKHSNIVEVLKVLRNKEPPWIVLEWMEDGDLLTFLRAGRCANMTSSQLIRFAAQIANGMSYMEEKQYVHCNLKASSIFVSNRTLKVGGFCLARKLRDGNVRELEEDVQLSMKWSAVDVIMYRQVTKKSDVWSFAIVLVEMFNNGEVPYCDMEVKEVVNKLRHGYRHPKPDNCSEGFYHVMKCCWNVPQDFRPSFKDLLDILENYQEGNDYRNTPRLSMVSTTFPAPSSSSSSSSNSSLYSSSLRGTGVCIRRHAVRRHDSAKRSSYMSYINVGTPGTGSVNSGSNYLGTPKLITSKTTSLYPSSSQDCGKDLQHISMASLKLLEQIGTGEFGEVWSAEMPDHNKVAVKMFIPTRMDRKEFLKEAEMMQKLNHPHLMPLIGICTEGCLIYIVTELMPLGCLLEYLQNDRGHTLLTHHLLEYAVQIADALVYMESMKCIHRDIAARNVLMRDQNTIKLGDFGLSRTVISSCYVSTQAVKLPARWTAPEAVNERTFSIKSDVWSYGVLLVELMTYGESPYSDMNTAEVLPHVSRGYKHPQPVDTCPDDIYGVMISCWRINPERRPSFLELYNSVKGLRDVYRENSEKLKEISDEREEYAF